MRSLRPQSLPICLLERQCLQVQGCLLADLQEEIYNQPVEQGRQIYENSASNIDNQIVMTKCRTPPLTIPCSQTSRQEEREEELYQELTHVYNDATWKMYHRIQKARNAQFLSDHNRSKSESYKSVVAD